MNRSGNRREIPDINRWPGGLRSDNGQRPHRRLRRRPSGQQHVARSSRRDDAPERLSAPEPAEPAPRGALPHRGQRARVGGRASRLSARRPDQRRHRPRPSPNGISGPVHRRPGQPATRRHHQRHDQRHLPGAGHRPHVSGLARHRRRLHLAAGATQLGGLRRRLLQPHQCDGSHVTRRPGEPGHPYHQEPGDAAGRRVRTQTVRSGQAVQEISLGGHRPGAWPVGAHISVRTWR